MAASITTSAPRQQRDATAEDAATRLYLGWKGRVEVLADAT
jgi:hypothetical protein